MCSLLSLTFLSRAFSTSPSFGTCARGTAVHNVLPFFNASRLLVYPVPSVSFPQSSHIHLLYLDDDLFSHHLSKLHNSATMSIAILSDTFVNENDGRLWWWMLPTSETHLSQDVYGLLFHVDSSNTEPVHLRPNVERILTAIVFDTAHSP